MHHTRSQEELEQAEPGVAVGVPQEEPAYEVHAEENTVDELQECLDHRPSSFEQGKPRSISPSVCECLTYTLTIFDALSLGINSNRCCILPCLPSSYHILVIPWYTELSKCLACLDR
jgi:hypothetical protein